MDKKDNKKDFLIGLMYNDGDLAHLSEGTSDCLIESCVDLNREPDNEKDK